MEIYSRLDFFGITRKRWAKPFLGLKNKRRRLLMTLERKAEIWESFVLLRLIFMWIQDGKKTYEPSFF